MNTAATEILGTYELDEDMWDTVAIMLSNQIDDDVCECGDKLQPLSVCEGNILFAHAPHVWAECDSCMTYCPMSNATKRGMRGNNA
jgi:hypothetical protein